MSTLFLSDLFINRIEALCEADISLSYAYKKVRGKIRGYAKFISVPITELKVVDVCDHKGDLHRKLVTYIDSLYPKSNTSASKNRKYKGEIFSILRRLILKIFGNLAQDNSEAKKAEIKNSSLYERQAPEWMRPLIDVLPRGSANGDRWLKRKDIVRYRELPLKESSVKFLDVLLQVVNSFGVQTLESLLVDYASEITSKLNETYPIIRRGLENYIYYCRADLGIKPPGRILQQVQFEKWSPKFQNQWENFEKLAPNGVPDGVMLARHAIQHETSVKPISKDMVSKYKRCLETGLYFCAPLPDNWGIEDLVALKLRTTKIGGFEQQEYYNEFIEEYRIREQNRVSTTKRSGYDSTSFSLFMQALRGVSAFNGFAHSVRPLNKAYAIKLDVESRKRRKDQKKRLCTIKEIDEQIARLEVDFDLTVKNKLYVYREGKSYQDAHKAMRLCLFYPTLLILRFVGLRQRNVRNCRIMRDPENSEFPDGNVGLRSDGTIVFHYEEHETKNKKRLHLEFNPRLHSETHGALIRGLTSYLRKVYPYIQKRAESPLERQLIMYQPFKRFSFVRYLSNDRKQFYASFMRWSTQFLKFEPYSREKYASIHPHFLRGLCTDWLINVLHFTTEQAADYICDDPVTLKNEYLDRNRIHDATSFVTEKNRALREDARERENVEISEQSRTEALRHNELVNLFTRQMQMIEERLKLAEARNADLQAQLAAKDDQIMKLLKELAQNDSYGSD